MTTSRRWPASRSAQRAVATSGRARRGFRIDGRWYSHVIDPRTGWPVDAPASVSVVAPTAEVADVVATVVGVLGPRDGLAVAERLGYSGLGCLTIESDGRGVEQRGVAVDRRRLIVR